MIDEAFFERWQRPLLWCANTWLGRLYLTSHWNRTTKQMSWRWIETHRFDRIAPSAFTAFIGFTREGRPRFVSRHYTSQIFARKVAQLLFWLPYADAAPMGRGWVTRPAFAYAAVALVAACCGMPVFAGTVSTFNTETGASNPVMDGKAAGIDTTWALARNASAAGDNGTTDLTSFAQAKQVNPSDFRAYRLFFQFNTGATIPSGATIVVGANTKLTLSTTGTAAINDDTTSLTVVQTNTPRTDGQFTGAEINDILPEPVSAGVSMTEGVDAADRFALSGYVINSTLSFKLNATGAGWIARSGETKPTGATQANLTRLGCVVLLDALDVEPTGNNTAEFYMADNGSNQPQLSVEWTGGFTFIGGTGATVGSAASTWSIVPPSTQVGGGAMVVGVGPASSGVTVSTMTDNTTNVYKRAVVRGTPKPAGAASELWYATGWSSLSTRISITLSGNSSGSIGAGHFTGISTGMPLGPTGSSAITANSTSHGASEVLPIGGSALAVSYARLNASTIGTITNLGGMSNWVTTNASGAVRSHGMYLSMITPSTVTGSFTTSSNAMHAEVIAIFYDTVITGGGTWTLCLMGVQ